jgi:hypothetical protein
VYIYVAVPPSKVAEQFNDLAMMFSPSVSVLVTCRGHHCCYQSGSTALVRACQCGQAAAVEVLIKAGADVNVKTEVRGLLM